ncbi:MAG: toprim domain-containing protein [Selenomonadaceae bacterium]|nr:toprim domain-containing protein [Selenomonadaceae bacterium]
MDNKQSFAAYVKEFVNLPFGALPPKQFHAEYLRLVEADIAEAQKHLEELPASERRGLTIETYRHFHCGYLPQWTLTKCRAKYHCGTYVDESGKLKRLPPASERIIIPTSNKHFNAVATPRARRDGLKKKFWKQHANDKELFCDPTALSADVIVVVEGEIDAMSIWQATNGKISPVAILGCENFAKTLGVHMSKLRDKKFILLLDADAAGKKAAEKLRNRLIQEKYSVVCRYLYDYMPPEFKKHPENIRIDANSILTDSDYGTPMLRRCIEKVIDSATNELNALAEKFAKERAELDALPTAEFTPDLSKIKSARQFDNSASTPTISKNFSGSNVTADISDADRDLVLDILDKVHACNLTRDEWFKFGCILKLYNFPYEVFDSWSNDGDPRYSSEACQTQWNSFGTVDTLNSSCAKIGTMIQIAKEKGYKMNHSKHTALIVGRSTQSEATNYSVDATTGDADLDAEIHSELIGWQNSHEDAPIKPETVQDICDAVVAVGAVTKNDVSANLVNSSMIRNVALLEYYLAPRAEKFYDVLREANVTGYSKTDYQARTKSVVAIIRKAQNAFEREVKKDIAAEDNRRRIQARAEQVKTNEDRLKELWTQPQSAERDAEIISLIRDSLDWKLTKHGDRDFVKSTQANINLMFAYDPRVKGLFGLDEFKNDIAFLRPPFWKPSKRKGEIWSDADDAHLRVYFRETYTEFVGDKLIADNVTTNATKNAFHEVKDYFESLPKWDGVKRAETCLIDVFKVDDTPYTRELALNVLTGAIARIYRPGCQYPYCPIIHGAQGIGKSYFLKMLGGKWYHTLEDNIGDPHLIDALDNTWLGEFAEFKGARKSDVNSTKAFITTTIDNRRKSYDRRVTEVKRHTVFFATVNDNEFLSDVTGNRRFPIVESRLKAGEHGREITQDYINQIWAEAYQRYMELFNDLDDDTLDHALELSPESKAIVEGTAKKFIRDDGLKLEIESFLDIPILPDVIWLTMTKDERRQFFVDGYFTIEEGDLEGKFASTFPKATPEQKAAFAEAKIERRNVVRKVHIGTKDNMPLHYRFYGCVQRQHICSSEINYECFGKTDKRKAMTRIGEVLQQLDGWHNGGRRQGFDRQYNDQTKCYYRNPADTKSNTQNNNQDTDKNNTQEEVLQNENSNDTDKTVSHGINLRNYDDVIVPNDDKSFEPFDGVLVDPDDLPF